MTSDLDKAADEALKDRAADEALLQLWEVSPKHARIVEAALTHHRKSTRRLEWLAEQLSADAITIDVEDEGLGLVRLTVRGVPYVAVTLDEAIDKAMEADDAE